MPKNVKSKKNTKNLNDKTEKRQIIYPDDGQVYGIIEKALGDRYFNVFCLDENNRRCKVRKKRMKIVVGDYVIIALRLFNNDPVNDVGDIIYKYESDEVRHLKINKLVPSCDENIQIEKIEEFDFNNI